MLNSFRSIAASIWAKLLLGLLVVSFCVWGIGDMVRTTGRNPSVATVGNVEITSNDFLRSMHMEAENLRRIMGDNFSPDLLKNAQLTHWVLQKLINNALLSQETEAMGLVPSDADVVRKIRGNPEFQDSKGNFDKNVYETRLKNSGLSEKGYVTQLRKDMSINLLMDTLTSATPVSEGAEKALLQAREEQRAVTIYSLSTALVSNISQPSEAQLKTYYDAHSHEFTAPEYRSVSFVAISSADIPKDLEVSQDELKAMYNDRIDEFKRSERREVEQLLFGAEDKARAAKELLKKGTSFEQVAKASPILNKDSISMGKIERSGLIAGAEEAVFSLSKGDSTDPIQSPFGWHIFHVLTIEPPSTLTFEEALPVLEKDVKQHGSDQALNKLANKFEDALAGGNTLQEAARDLKLKVQSAGPLNRQGQSPDGSAAKGLPNYEKFIDAVFKTEEKSESPMMTAKGGVFYIVRVDSITPEHLKTLAEVKSQLTNACLLEEKQKKLAILVKEVADKFKSSAERATVIAKYNLQSLVTTQIKHTSHNINDIELPPAFISDIFSRRIQEGTDPAQIKNGAYLIAVVNNIIASGSPEKDVKLSNALNDIHKNLESSAQNELLEQYTHYLTKKYPVSVNEDILQAVLK